MLGADGGASEPTKAREKKKLFRNAPFFAVASHLFVAPFPLKLRQWIVYYAIEWRTRKLKRKESARESDEGNATSGRRVHLFSIVFLNGPFDDLPLEGGGATMLCELSLSFSPGLTLGGGSRSELACVVPIDRDFVGEREEREEKELFALEIKERRVF